MKVAIFTDGGCHNAGRFKGIGAWAYVIVDDKGNLIFEKSKLGDPGTTNNRMEYIAFLEALKWCLQTKFITQIDAFSDSRLLIDSFTNWIYGWKKAGTIDKKKNPDLLREMSLLREELDLTLINFRFQWVKAHNGNKWNEHCDKACTRLIQEAIRPMARPETTLSQGKTEAFEVLFNKIWDGTIHHDEITSEELTIAKQLLHNQKPHLLRAYAILK